MLKLEALKSVLESMSGILSAHLYRGINISTHSLTHSHTHTHTHTHTYLVVVSEVFS